ncbi:MAG: ABC transporter substrate-binding protein [Acidimicrobiales bacterium]
MSRFRILGVVIALGLLAAACSDSSDDTSEADQTTTAVSETTVADATTTEAPQQTTTAPPETTEVAAITVGLQLEPATLDPTASPEGPIQTVELYNLIETLIKLGPTGEFEPLLAESWDVSDDGLTYTFNLRQGVVFHDGASFGADDVVFSLDRARDEANGHPFGSQLAVVDTVTALDDSTVEVVLSKFSANFLFNMAQSVGMIFDEASVDSLADAPVGTGPYAFSEWVRGDSITVVANPDYWGDAPLLDSITYRYIPDANALNNAILAGDIEIIAGVSAPELLEVFQDDPAFDVQVGTTNGEVTMALNNRTDALSDVRVRQALSFAIDRQAVIDGAYFGYGEIIGTFAVPTDPYYVDLTDVYAYDPDKALALLEEAGWAEGLELTFKLPPPSYARRSGEIIQSQLSEVGVDVTIENVEWPVWLEDVFNVEGVEGAFNYDLSIVAHVEPRDIGQYGNPDYYFGYDNPDVQAELAAADAEADDATRYAELGDVQRQITADAASIWLFVLPNLAVTVEGIGGFSPNSVTQALDMTNVSYNPS